MIDKQIENIRRNKHKLTIGELYSYKQLTEILDIEYLNSNSKKAQLKEINTVIELEKVKTKYKIVSIRKQETSIIKNKKRATYSDDVLLSALYFLLKDTKEEDKEIVKYVNRDALAYEIGLKHKNNNIVAKYYPKKFCNQLDVDTSTFNYVYPKVMNVINSAISYLFKNIQKKKLATIFNRYEIVTIDNNTRVATDEEYAKIESIKRDILTEMKIDNEYFLYNKYCNYIQEFYIKVNKETISQLGIINSYKFLEIHMNRKSVDNYLKTFKHMSLDEALRITNEKFLKKQLTNSKNDKNRKLKQDVIPAILLLENFNEDSTEIIENLISINADDLIVESKAEFKAIEG